MEGGVNPPFPSIRSKVLENGWERMGTDGNGRNGWGRFLVVEVKAQAGRLRPEQTLFLERIRAAGGVAFVARDCRDVLRELRTP
jgi:hypothetical protein